MTLVRSSKSRDEPPICYTEDNTIVRVIYVSNLDRCSFPVTTSSLKNYFARAGPVEKVSLIKKPDHKFAFVTFKNAEDAYKVLNDKSYKTKMTVRKADSWHQPKSSEPIDSNSYDEYGLLRLNDDCLYYLLSFLNPVDAVNLASTDDRILMVATRYFKKYSTFDCETVDISRKRSKQEIDRLYQFIGPYITTLSFSSGCHSLSDDQAMKVFANHCCSVENLTLKNVSSFHSNSLRKQFFASIKKLTMRDCEISDMTLMKLFDTSKSRLEHLELYDCRIVTGKFLQKLPKITTLKFRSCLDLEESNIGKGLKNSSSLKELTITGCELGLDELKLSSLKNLEKLETDLSYYYDFFTLDKLLVLERLTKLNLISERDINIDDFLLKLGQKDILEELMLYRLNITDATMVAFESLKKLKSLHLVAPVNDNGKFFNRLPLVLPGLKSFVCRNGNLTFDISLMIIKALNLLEFIDISDVGVVTEEQVKQIFDILKKNSKRPLLRVLVEDVMDLFTSNWEKAPFIFEGKCIMEIDIRNYCDESVCAGLDHISGSLYGSLYGSDIDGSFDEDDYEYGSDFDQFENIYFFNFF